MVSSAILLSLLFLIIIVLEVPRLYIKKMWREMAAFWAVTLGAMIYSYGLVFNLPLPNPNLCLVKIFTPVMTWIENFFGVTA